MLKSFTSAPRRLVCQIHGFSSEMIFFIFFIYVHLVHSVSHTLITTYTGVNGQTVAETPEVSSVTKLDGQQIDYYDSVTKNLIPKQDWMKEFASTETWKEYTKIREQSHCPTVSSSGVQKYQRMYGCSWNYVTGHIYGFDEYSYDGQDFITLDLEELRYIASVPEAIPTVMKWNNDREQLVYLKQYYRDKCTDWIYFLTSRKDDFERRGATNTYFTVLVGVIYALIVILLVLYAGAVLLVRKMRSGYQLVSSSESVIYINKGLSQSFVAPEVSLLHKDPFSPVVCHATGFYPSAVNITWLRNGEEHDEDVDHGELLPNEDETFQKTVSLRVTPDEWEKHQYVCVVEHETGTILRNLTEDEIKSNYGPTKKYFTILVGLTDVFTVILVVLVVLVIVTALIVWKIKRSGLIRISDSNDNDESLKGFLQSSLTDFGEVISLQDVEIR
ncbi:major histocompatibility complex class I-related gene protein-like [Carassius auratus]|uniref:Major histocompatibility complex class I-related gene protein-like n=1 Tax=Carassius auratus TaxID=7957 RepID=A0A6P6NFS7_CARAU|nr:major histocompatibility complex class I-related gene protein-like [Carassius auratus]